MSDSAYAKNESTQHVKSMRMPPQRRSLVVRRLSLLVLLGSVVLSGVPAVAQHQARQQAVASAKVSLDATEKGYEIGTGSIIDLLTATTNFAEAQRNYYLALYTQLVAKTQLNSGAGILTPALIKDLLYGRPTK
jgi:hypothetical protein